jgi:hypothetical protein
VKACHQVTPISEYCEDANRLKPFISEGLVAFLSTVPHPGLNETLIKSIGNVYRKSPHTPLALAMGI